MRESSNHIVAVIGGSIAGSEAAYQLAEQGINVAVFDQKALPYGKIEDGLPLWHIKLRDKEENRIDEKLSHKNICFVPKVKLGRDIEFEDIVNNWGFSAVLLAIGAWVDKPLPVKGIDSFIGQGLIYQNPLMYWFNHKHEPGYNGPKYKIKDGTTIIGGGLASLDVVKVAMIELVKNALLKFGIRENVFSLEKGISSVLKSHNLTLEKLGLKGCTLYYRRRAQDMPLSNIVRNTKEKREKAEMISLKILNNAREKYLFNFRDCISPVDFMTDEKGRLNGLIFQKNKVVDGKAVPVEGQFEKVISPVIISSIGSLPERIPGIPSDDSKFKMVNSVHCQIEGYENVFAIGNAVTGRGNIKESLEHGKIVTLRVMEEYLSENETEFHNFLRSMQYNVGQQAESIVELIRKRKMLEIEGLNAISQKIHALHQKSGYQGDYKDWVSLNKPPRLEEIISEN